jgi:hypothetical protein
VAELGVVDRSPDGTSLYAARGELPVDVDEQRVQCHLCGGWYRALGSSHLWRIHGVTADECRELVGLRPRRPLWAPDLIDAQRERLRACLAAEPRRRAAMAEGHALARRGELRREDTPRLAQRPASLERERQLGVAGARLGNGRAAAFRRRRELRALALGFADLVAYHRRRYGDERRRLDELAAELGCAESAVRGDLQPLGLGPDRALSHGARRENSALRLRRSVPARLTASRWLLGCMEPVLQPSRFSFRRSSSDVAANRASVDACGSSQAGATTRLAVTPASPCASRT